MWATTRILPRERVGQHGDVFGQCVRFLGIVCQPPIPLIHDLSSSPRVKLDIRAIEGRNQCAPHHYQNLAGNFVSFILPSDDLFAIVLNYLIAAFEKAA